MTETNSQLGINLTAPRYMKCRAELLIVERTALRKFTPPGEGSYRIEIQSRKGHRASIIKLHDTLVSENKVFCTPIQVRIKRDRAQWFLSLVLEKICLSESRSRLRSSGYRTMILIFPRPQLRDTRFVRYHNSVS